MSVEAITSFFLEGENPVSSVSYITPYLQKRLFGDQLTRVTDSSTAAGLVHLYWFFFPLWDEVFLRGCLRRVTRGRSETGAASYLPTTSSECERERRFTRSRVPLWATERWAKSPWRKTRYKTHSLQRPTTVWLMNGDRCERLPVELFVSLVASSKISIWLGCEHSDTVIPLFFDEIHCVHFLNCQKQALRWHTSSIWELFKGFPIVFLLRLWWGKVRRWTATWRSALDGRWASSLQICCRRSERVQHLHFQQKQQQKHIYPIEGCNSDFLTWHLTTLHIGMTMFVFFHEFDSHEKPLMYETHPFIAVGFLKFIIKGYCFIFLLIYLFLTIFLISISFFFFF